MSHLTFFMLAINFFSLFFLINPARDLSIWSIFSKVWLSPSLIFLYFFSLFYSIDFCSLLLYSFCLFYLTFSSFSILRWNAILLIWDFLFSNINSQCYKFPFKHCFRYIPYNDILFLIFLQFKIFPNFFGDFLSHLWVIQKCVVKKKKKKCVV